MSLAPNDPTPKFDNGLNFQIKRNEAATVILPAFPNSAPVECSIAFFREKSDGTPALLMELYPWQETTPQGETKFQVSLDDMTQIAAPSIRNVRVAVRYGESSISTGPQSNPYEVID